MLLNEPPIHHGCGHLKRNASLRSQHLPTVQSEAIISTHRILLIILILLIHECIPPKRILAVENCIQLRAPLGKLSVRAGTILGKYNLLLHKGRLLLHRRLRTCMRLQILEAMRIDRDKLHRSL